MPPCRWPRSRASVPSSDERPTRPESQPPARDRLAPREPAALGAAAGAAAGAASRGIVARPRLVRPLLDDSQALAVLVAPAGYGKSTVLAEWRAQDPRPFAWADLAPSDDDPDRLRASIAVALSEIEPLTARSASVDDLVGTLASLRPAVLVLDDVHLLRSGPARAVVAALAARMPPGTTLALASRHDLPVPLGRMRAQDEVVELRSPALTMTRSEAGALLRMAGVCLAADDLDRLIERTAGWPAALRLAVRALAEQEDAAAAVERFDGEDSIVVDYVGEEVLSDLEPEDRAFLLRTSVLETLSGPACDAVLGRRDSAAVLRRLSRANALLMPLDRTELAFRQHPLLRQALGAELRCSESQLAPELHRRASAWHEREGDADGAVEHAVAAGDSDRVSDLLADGAATLVAAGREAELDAWLSRLAAEDVTAHPSLVLAEALSSAVRGEGDAAQARLATAGAGCGPSVEAGFAVVAAALGRDGADGIVGDGVRAYAVAPDQSPWRAFACLLEGSGRLLCGQFDAAKARLEEGARRSILDAPLVGSLCCAELAFIALQAGDREDAAALAARARRPVEHGGDDAYPLAALTFAVSAFVQAERGQLDAAGQDVTAAMRRLAALPDVAPWYASLAHVALARAQLRLSDADEARRLLTEATRLLRRVDGAVALRGWIDDAWACADDYAAGPVACPSALTRAELRVLRFLPSHLSFREIAARLHVSANTVKTQAHAVYRKLDATSRSEAVAHARALGLVDAEISRTG